MNVAGKTITIDYAARADAELVQLALCGHRDAFSQIMSRNNQRLFRIARGIVNDGAQAEDVVQEAYFHAFDKLTTFRGDASLPTWLARIVVNEARRRLRDERPRVDLAQLDKSSRDDSCQMPLRSKFGEEDPAACASRAQIRTVIEHALGQIPAPFRVVFMLREIEECTVEETAAILDIRAETVKTRLHRAHRLLRMTLKGTMEATLHEAFPFLGTRCRRMTEAVLDRIAAGDRPDAPRAPRR